MSVFDRAKEFAARAVDQGRERADDLRQRRERSRLMGELGEACYQQAKGDPDAAGDIDRLVERIDELEAPQTDTETEETDLTATQPAETAESEGNNEPANTP